MNGGGSQLKAFLRQFSPTTTKMVDVLLATALDLVNIKHFKTGLQAAVTVLHKPEYAVSVTHNKMMSDWKTRWVSGVHGRGRNERQVFAIPTRLPLVSATQPQNYCSWKAARLNWRTANTENQFPWGWRWSVKVREGGSRPARSLILRDREAHMSSDQSENAAWQSQPWVMETQQRLKIVLNR